MEIRFNETDATYPNELWHRIAAEELMVLIQGLLWVSLLAGVDNKKSTVKITQ